MKLRFTALAATLCVASSLPASVYAQAPNTAHARGDQCHEASQRNDPNLTCYDMDATGVPGGRYSPNEEHLTVRARREHGSLINIRWHFVRELQKSVEAL